MFAKLRVHFRHNVVGYIALFVALGGTGAYAADTIGSSDVIDESLLSQDIKNGEVKTTELANLGVTNSKLDNNAVSTGKIIDGNVFGFDLADNAVTSAKIADGQVGSAEVRDFALTNRDIGVLFAEVTSTPFAVTLSNSSGGVSVTRIGSVGTGKFSVDFGRNITQCTAVATIGNADTTGINPGGEVYVSDQPNNVEAVNVDTNTSTGAAADKPFRLVVVC